MLYFQILIFLLERIGLQHDGNVNTPPQTMGVKIKGFRLGAVKPRRRKLTRDIL